MTSRAANNLSVGAGSDWFQVNKTEAPSGEYLTIQFVHWNVNNFFHVFNALPISRREASGPTMWLNTEIGI